MTSRDGIPPTIHPGTALTRWATSPTFRLAVLFGGLAFLQGVGEPTEGLMAQPVRSLLMSWGRSAATITTFSALLALPWTLKPLFGLLTDFVPLGNTRPRAI